MAYGVCIRGRLRRATLFSGTVFSTLCQTVTNWYTGLHDWTVASDTVSTHPGPSLHYQTYVQPPRAKQFL